MLKGLTVSISMLYLIYYLLIFKYLGLSTYEALLASISLVLLASFLENFNVSICKKILIERTVKPIFISLDNRALIEQNVKFNVSSVSEVLVNITGFIIPLIVAMVATVRYLLITYNAVNWIMLTLFLTIAFNRLSIFVRGKGLGVPLISAVLLSSMSSLAVSLANGLLNVHPYSSFIQTLTSSSIAAAVGIDVMGLRRLAIYKAKRVIMGGLGSIDAVAIIPVTSSLVTLCLTYVLISIHLSAL